VRLSRQDETIPWRVSLEDPHTGEQRHFADAAMALAFLETWLGTSAPATEQSAAKATAAKAEIDAMLQHLETMRRSLKAFISGLEADNRRLRQLSERMAAIAEVGGLVTTGGDLQEMLNTLAGKIATAAGFDGVRIGLYDARKEELSFPAIFTTHPMSALKAGIGAAVRLADTPLLEQLLRHRQHLYFDDPQNDPRLREEQRDLARENGIQVVLTWPLLYGARLIGTLDLYSARPRRFSVEEMHLFSILASQAAIAIRNARLYVSLQERLDEVEARQRVTQAILESLELEERLDMVLDETMTLVGAEIGAIYLAESGILRIVAQRGLSAELGQVIGTFPLDGQPAWLAASKAWQQAGNRAARWHSQMAAPLSAREMDVGTIILASPRREAFTDGHSRALAGLASQTAVVIENARLLAETQHHLHELSLLFELSAALRSGMRVDEMLPPLLQQTMAALNVDGAMVLIVDPGSDELRALAAGGVFEPLDGMTYPLPEMPAACAMRAGKPCFGQQECPFFPDAGQPLKMACVPFKIGEQTLGGLHVGRHRAELFSAEELRLLTGIADMAANALRRAGVMETLEQRVADRTAELAEAKERVEAILASVGDQVVVTDLNGVIISVNAAYEKLTGYSAAEASGQKPSLLASGQTPPQVYQQMWAAITQGQIWSGELINRRKDGSLYDAHLTIAPVRNQAGHIVGYVGSERDISQQNELARLKDKFVSDVSHELRTPVTNLSMYLDLLERGQPEKRARYMAVLKEQTGRLGQLIEDILNLSRLEIRQGKRGELAPVDLNAVVQQVVAAHWPRAEAANLQLVFQPEAGLLPAQGDVSQLTQVVTNLVANAINYTPAGGSIRCQLSQSSADSDPWLLLTVADTGMGIEPEDLPHLFERFYRGQQAAQSEIPGTGLGLGIVKEIVDWHGGRIEVESEVGVGSTFRVWLPAFSG